MSVWRILFLNAHPLYANGLAAGLRQIGHDVRIFDPGPIPRYLHGRAVGELIDAVRPDIVLSMGHVEHFMDSTAVFDAIRHRRSYHVYWATEDRSFHERISLPCARSARAVFTLDAGCLPRYRTLGIPADLLPFACNPAVHHGYPIDRTLAHDLVLLGNNTPAWGAYRQKALIDLLQPFLGGGYDLAVWGYGWEEPFAAGYTLPKRFHYGRLSYEDAVRAACSARIVLGPQWDASSPTQVSCRTFETLGAGGFLLTSDVPGVRALFQDGVHLATTDSPGRTNALVEHYLSSQDERRAIAARGQSLVHAQHTYVHRACQFTAAVSRWRRTQGPSR